MLSILLAAVIQLPGVTGSDLRARAFFDANNVKVGDPLVLTIDFLGRADFAALHPPSLSRQVDRRDWKLDDVSAKTDTFRDARRLTYRVRPMREGVLWFPSLEFGYVGEDGEARTARANAIPVHAKVGAQVVVDEMGEDPNKMPQPDPLLTDAPDGLSDDESFAWRKACSAPTEKAFAAFDFPAARLNEARCAILAGNWARALAIYSRLEWTTGQTPAIERGIVAALALKHDNPSVELPVWRQVGRPILVYGWKGRLGLAGGAIAALALLFWLVGRGIRAVACLAFAVLLAGSASAQGIFEQMERQMQQMRRQMQQMTSGFGFHFGEKEEREPVRVTASLATDRAELQVGEPFAFVVSIEAPRTCSIGEIRLTPSDTFGMTVTGQAENLTDGTSANTNNLVKRLAIPVRYDVPFKGPVSFTIEGMVSGRQSRHGGRFSFTFSNSFSCETAPLTVEIRPLSTDGQPADFSGIISEGLGFHELPDILRLETNDVVTLTYRLRPNGFVPAAFLPKGAAFEWTRQTDRSGHVTEIEYRGYFVADGAPTTPKVEISYYDPRTKSYRRAKAGGTPLTYTTEARP